jgi:membrane fusion protein, macrolide-specific efflux system
VRFKWLAVGGIAVAVILAVVVFRKDKSLDIAYREVNLGRGDLEVTILSTGVVQPENRLEIKPPISGRIDDVLVKEGQVVRKGTILAWMSSTERAALMDAARSKGADELSRWQELYRATPIMAPINGTIILRNVEPGQTFTNQDPVFVMSDRLTIKAQVDETDIAQIKLKQKATVVLDAYPGQTIPARVDQIAFDAKTVNNVTTYVVDVLPESPSHLMRSGMTANVSFSVALKNDVLLIPNEAVKAEDGTFFVMIPSKDRKNPARKIVEVGITDGKLTEVLSGLVEGDVVLAADFKLAGKNASTQTNPFSPIGRVRRGGGGR